jgi:hypothetical protein
MKRKEPAQVRKGRVKKASPNRMTARVSSSALFSCNMMLQWLFGATRPIQLSHLIAFLTGRIDFLSGCLFANKKSEAIFLCKRSAGAQPCATGSSIAKQDVARC